MRNLTNTMIKGYIKAKHEWIKANDNYNKLHFGITEYEYKIIDRCVYHAYGILPPTVMSLSKLKNFLELAIQEVDTEQRYKK